MKNRIILFLAALAVSSIVSSCVRSGHNSQPWQPNTQLEPTKDANI